MVRATPATRFLEMAGVAFALHEYDYESGADRIGVQAATALGVDPRILLKTLMAEAGTVVCALLPSSVEMSLKKLAVAARVRDARMLAPSAAERITGYRIGGISPFGQRKRVPAFIAAEALAEPRIFVNGGGRGLQIEIAPADLVRLLNATPAALS